MFHESFEFIFGLKSHFEPEKIPLKMSEKGRKLM